MRFHLAVTSEHRRQVSSLTCRQLIDLVSCPNFYDQVEPDQEYGAVFLHPRPLEMMKTQLERYRDRCTLPPLACGDVACGVPGRMPFPEPLGALASPPELIRQLGYETAQLARDIGLGFGFSPVHMLREIDSPISSYFAAGQTVEEVLKFTENYQRGLLDGGLMNSISFPVDGDTLYDQHLTTSITTLSKEDWMAGPGRILTRLYDGGATAVMVKHIAMPAWDAGDRADYPPPPASVSSKLMNGLIREELGFDGLLISDAMIMGGVANYMNYFDACAKFLASGGDCLLFSPQQHPKIGQMFYDEMARRIDSGMLPFERLLDAAARMVAFKYEAARRNESIECRYDPARYEQCARESARHAVCIDRDRDGMLPLPAASNRRIAHIIITGDDQPAGTRFAHFTSALRSYGEVVELIDPGCDQIFEKVAEGLFDLLVVSIGNCRGYSLGTVRLHGPGARNMMHGWMKLGTPAVFITCYHPFIAAEFDAAIDTLITTCGNSEYVIDPVMEAIFGK